MKVCSSRKAFGTVYRKRLCGRDVIYTKEVVVDRAEWCDAEAQYQHDCKIKRIAQKYQR